MVQYIVNNVMICSQKNVDNQGIRIVCYATQASVKFSKLFASNIKFNQHLMNEWEDKIKTLKYHGHTHVFCNVKKVLSKFLWTDGYGC